MTPLPIADGPWFRVRRVADDVLQIDEPHVDEFLRANIWHVRGRDRDLVVDAGLGVASLRDELPVLFEHDPVLVVTHAHLDHTGGASEFDDARISAAEAGRSTIAGSLIGSELAALLGHDGGDLPPLLLDALPSASVDPATWRPPDLPSTTPLRDGDEIDLGDRRFRVLHLPGHTAGDIALVDAADGTLCTGDVLYDDELLDELPESDIARSVTSLRRLQALPVSTVLPGHGDSFPASRMHELIAAYLARRA